MKTITIDIEDDVWEAIQKKIAFEGVRVKKKWVYDSIFRQALKVPFPKFKKLGQL